eukprot:1895726-Rhodomonas_salina.1
MTLANSAPPCIRPSDENGLGLQRAREREIEGGKRRSTSRSWGVCMCARGECVGGWPRSETLCAWSVCVRVRVRVHKGEGSHTQQRQSD